MFLFKSLVATTLSLQGAYAFEGCQHSWFGGCKDGNDIALSTFNDKYYSIEDCYQKCIDDPNCDHFITIWGDKQDKFCRTMDSTKSSQGCPKNTFKAKTRAVYKLGNCKPPRSDPVSKKPIPDDPVVVDVLPKDPVSKDPVPKDPVSKDPVPMDPVVVDVVPKDPVPKDPLDAFTDKLEGMKDTFDNAFPANGNKQQKFSKTNKDQIEKLALRMEDTYKKFCAADGGKAKRSIADRVRRSTTGCDEITAAIGALEDWNDENLKTCDNVKATKRFPSFEKKLEESKSKVGKLCPNVMKKQAKGKRMFF